MADGALAADIITVLETALEGALGASVTPTVLARPLRPTDPDVSIGVYLVDWTPRDYQIGQNDPVVGLYEFRVDLLVKHIEEMQGRTLSAKYAKMIRTMLYGDGDLRVALSQTTEEFNGLVERVQKCGVRVQRFLNNEIKGTFLYLASSEFYVETETV